MSALAEQLITEEESIKQQPYYDSKGYVSWGIGHLADPRLPCAIPLEVIRLMFKYDSQAAISEAAKLVPGFMRLNEVQQAAWISTIFQLGPEPFDGDGFKDFKDMLAASRAGDVKAAAAAGRDSKWWREDSPNRAERQMRMLETGIWVPHGVVK